MRRRFLLIALILDSLAAVSRAGETRCWLDNGVVVVPAALGDIAGDFILDLSAPRSQLHVTVAQEFGLDGDAASGELRLAGEARPASFAIVDLDARAADMPTNIAGVIGWDALSPYVVELSLAPCRLRLWRARPPRLRSAERLPLAIDGGVPTVAATVTDGREALRGRFAIDTGSAGVRLSAALASLSRSPPDADAASRTDPPARLAGLGLGSQAWARVAAGLDPQPPAGLAGGIGDAVWSRYAEVRIDAGKGWLYLAPPSRAPAPSIREDR